MDRTKAFIAAAAFIAGVGSTKVIGQPDAPKREIVNMRLIKSEIQIDGGTRWYGNACAYINEGNGHQSETCWDVLDVPVNVISPVENVFLDSK